MSELDQVVHQPTRLRILVVLSEVDTADFRFLQNTLSLTNGNLSSHTRYLEDAGYIEVLKTFQGRIPRTTYSITSLGRSRLEAYWRAIDEIRGTPSTR